MQGISKKEIKVIADLEFRRLYYFTFDDISNHFNNKKQMLNWIYTLTKKGRIIRLNKNKYFLVPIKARTGKWTDEPLIITDEICNGKDYYVGGWYSAYYWKLTEQVPMQVDIYTTKRQGKLSILNKRFVFHRARKNAIEEAVTEFINNHAFRIISREKAIKWMKSRE
jgi:predicted transcriptional regulator of viral defense system